MDDDDDDEELAPAAERSHHLMGQYTIERFVLGCGVPTDRDTPMLLKILLSTCHGCGDDLAERGKPANLLCPRCQTEAVWLRN
jgi:hypothetical protein